MFFTKYLSYLKAEHSEHFASYLETGAKAKGKFQAYLGAVFNNIRDLDVPLPRFNPLQLEILVEDIQNFLCEDFARFQISPLTNLANVEDTLLLAHLDDLKKNSKLIKFVRALMDSAIDELWGENNEIRPEIMELLQLNPANQIFPIVPQQVLYVFCTEIIMPEVIKTWHANETYAKQLIEKMDCSLLARKIIRTVTHDLNEEIPPNKRLSDMLNKIWLSSSNQKQITQSVTRMVPIINNFIHHGLAAETNLVVTYLFPEDDEQNAKKLDDLLKQSWEVEVARALKCIPDFITSALHSVMPTIFKQKLADYEKYGRSLIDDYTHGNAAKYFSQESIQLYNHPFVFSPTDLDLPFAKQTIMTLTSYFHEILLNIDQTNLPHDKKLKNFITKIILYSFAEVLDAHGNVKENIISRLSTDNATFVNDENARRQLVASYLRLILISMFYYWLNREDLQNEINAKGYSDQKIGEVIAVIEQALVAGLALQFIESLQGFPLFGQTHLAPRFVLQPEISSPHDRNLTSIYVDLKATIKLVTGKLSLNEDFMQEKNSRLYRLQEFTQQFSERIQFFEKTMGVFFESFTVVASTATELKQQQVLAVQANINIRSKLDKLSTLVHALKVGYSKLTLPDLLASFKIIDEQQNDIRIALQQQRRIANNNMQQVNLWLKHRSHIHAIEVFCIEITDFANSLRQQLDIAQHTAKLAQDKYIERGAIVSGSMYTQNLRDEEDKIKLARANITSCLIQIEDYCSQFKTQNLENLLAQPIVSLREDVQKNLDEIAQQKKLLLTNVYRITGIVEKFMERKKAADLLLKEVYDLFYFILMENNQLWSSCIPNLFGGGDTFFSENDSYTFPKRIAAMMQVLKKQDANQDCDLKLVGLLAGFKQTLPGWSLRRAPETAEFYKIISLANSALISGNFYDPQSLHDIIAKQKKFVQEVNPKFMLHERYKILAQATQAAVPVPQEIYFHSMYR